MNITFIRRAATSAIAAACLSACGGGGSGGSSAPASTPTTPVTNPTGPTTPINPSDPVPPSNPVQFGTAAVSVAGEPGCGFDHVNLTITKLRFNMDANATDASPGWTDIALTVPRRVDTAQLRNGATLSLASAALLPGHYGQARIVLDPNSSGNTTNSVVLAGTSAELPLITQAVAPQGVQFSDGFDIANGQALDLVVNVDSCRSILPNNSGFLLRPVLGLVPAARNGIGGFVDKSLLGKNVLITAQKNGVVMRASLADSATGEFNLGHLPAGLYDVVITANGSAAAAVANVAVDASAVTTISSAAAPIALDASGTGVIDAILGLQPASLVEAPYGSALQSFDNGPLLTIGYRMANLASGKVHFANLPLGRPMLAQWKAGQPLVWDRTAPFGPGAATYTIASSAPGYTTTRTLAFVAGD